MATIVSTRPVIREEGYLYYLGKSSKVERVKRGGGGRQVVGEEIITRKPRHLYFVNAKGEVGEVMMSRGKHKVEARAKAR